MKKLLLLSALTPLIALNPISAKAQDAAQDGSYTKKPALLVTTDPLPVALTKEVYTKPNQTADISKQDIMQGYYGNEATLVGRKINELNVDLGNLRQEVRATSARLVDLQRAGQDTAANYFANVATISTQLQSGTTPGNPRLVQKLANAQDSLDQLSNNITHLNELTVEVKNSQSVANYLLETARQAYGISGAIEEDHVMLAKIEDEIEHTATLIRRIINNVSDDVSRTASYLSTERSNLRTMSLAITSGDLMGKSLSRHPFSRSPQYAVDPAVMAGMGSESMRGGHPAIAAPKNQLLAKIRFEKDNVNYQQSVYGAMRKALEEYPNAMFKLVAIYPETNNAAQAALSSTAARRNAEDVLRSMTEMGMPMDRLELGQFASTDAEGSEVHVYIH
ncbi:MAG: hypothetical protein VYC19_06955 [Pseudomonadota bacterium]|nr:hypothetical protein [Pseudomonadota bacterium]